jgi:hypothetical protein
MSEHHIPAEYKTSGQDFMISVGGYVTCMVTAFILWQIQAQTQFAFYLYSVWFVIPVGAIVSGVVASSGYYFVARIFNHRPTRLLLVNILIGAVATFFLIYYFQYLTQTANGKRVADLMSYPQFVSSSLRSTLLQLDTDTSGPSGALGSWGYLFALLQVAGFAYGGFAIYKHLVGKPYCDRCSRYMAAQERHLRYAPNSDEAKAAMSRITAELAGGAMTAAIDEAKTLGTLRREHGDVLRAWTTIKHCTKCDRHWAKFMVQQKSGFNWKFVRGYVASAYADQPAAF